MPKKKERSSSPSRIRGLLGKVLGEKKEVDLPEVEISEDVTTKQKYEVTDPKLIETASNLNSFLQNLRGSTKQATVERDEKEIPTMLNQNEITVIENIHTELIPEVFSVDKIGSVGLRIKKYNDGNHDLHVGFSHGVTEKVFDLTEQQVTQLNELSKFVSEFGRDGIAQMGLNETLKKDSGYHSLEGKSEEIPVRDLEDLWLKGKVPGTYIIRPSESYPGLLSLSVEVKTSSDSYPILDYEFTVSSS